MKKHLLGFGIFSFIVVSFGVVFAFLYAPKIPQVPQFEEVRQPVFEINKRNKCDKKSKYLAFEVISTQYDLDQKKLITQIRMKLNSAGDVPESVSVTAKLYFDNQMSGSGIESKYASVKISEIDREKNEAVFYMISEFNQEIKRTENLYAVFNFIPKFTPYNNTGTLYKTEITPVLFVHGKLSVIKN